MLYSKDANCIYYIDEQYPDELMFIPLAKDGTFTLDDSGAVDYEMMKGEQVNDNLTFDELYDTVRKSLVGQGGK